VALALAVLIGALYVMGVGLYYRGLINGCLQTGCDYGLNFTVGRGDVARTGLSWPVYGLLLVAIEVCYALIYFGVAVLILRRAPANSPALIGAIFLLAWGASALSQRAPTERHTYGLKSSSILAALFNAIFLLLSVGAIAWEAVRRLVHPSVVAAPTVIWVAAVGIVVNTVTALLFFSGRKTDLNIRAAFLHMSADAAISLCVLIAGFIILGTGADWLDPAVSLGIVAVIVWGTWGLLRDSLNLALQAVPEGIDLNAVRRYLTSLPHVKAVHDLHIWPMSTTETALTAHLVRDVEECDCALLAQAADDLRHKFQIQHTTLQFETSDHECSLASENTV
jgi:cobalt-zinc-cadmium efflux system protein